MPSSRNDQREPNSATDRSSTGKSNRGFAAMNKEEQREIARKGGEAVSRNREHMAEIGRRGGEASGSNRSSKAKNNRVENNGNFSNREGATDMRNEIRGNNDSRNDNMGENF